MKHILTFLFLLLISATGSLAQRTIVVCDGDSLTYGTGASVPATKSYSAQMLLGSTAVTNTGVPGETIDTNRAATRTLAAFAGADSGATKVVVIGEGINDIATNDSAANIIADLDFYIATVRAAYPAAIIIGTTLTDYVGMGGTFQGRVDTVNTHILTTADFDHTVDLASNANLDDPSDLTYYDADGVHRTDAGYLVVAQAVQAVLLANDLIGTRYHVRTDGADTNDGRANAADTGGTTAQAWLTIGKAASTMTFGDSVMIVAGTYAEDVTAGNAGTSASPISYLASGTVSMSTFICNKAYTNFTGITFTGAQIADSASQVHGILINSLGDNCTITDCNFAMDTASSGAVLSFGDNTVILRPTVTNVWQSCIQLAGNGSSCVDGNFSQDHSADAFHILADDIIIDGNTFDGWNAAVSQTSGTLKIGMRYYFLDNGTSADFSNVGAGAGPYTEGEGAGWTATGTTPTSWGGATLDLGNHPDIIQAAQSYGYPSSKRCIFRNNIVKNSNAGVQFGNITDDGNTNNISDWMFYNNIIRDLTRTMNLAAPGFSFYNNTFYQSATEQTAPFTMIYGSQGRANNTTIKNNLFVECGTATSTSQGWYYTGDAVTGLDADYNLVVGTGAGTTKQNTMWREGQTGGTANSQEANGINGTDPLFTNAAAGDFTLQSGSPARNAGADLSAYFTTDATGATRSAWDIGAYEYGASIGITVTAGSVTAGTVSINP